MAPVHQVRGDLVNRALFTGVRNATVRLSQSRETWSVAIGASASILHSIDHASQTATSTFMIRVEIRSRPVRLDQAKPFPSVGSPTPPPAQSSGADGQALEDVR